MVMFSYQFFDFSQLMAGKAPILCEADWVDSEFAFFVLTADVDVGGFGVFVGKETKLVRSLNFDRRHGVKMAATSRD
jgi:hypothetical protein